MFTKEMLNQVSNSNLEDIFSFSRSEDVKLNTEESERNQRKRKKESDAETSVKKKQELEWKPEDCAQPIGKLIKFSGEGRNKKCHYERFEFHGNKYGLDDSALFIPEDTNRKPYAAIIKDIYIQGKEGYVKLEVQWFYRPEDVEKKHVGKWKSQDARDLFYSFHRDEVFAESVLHSCNVYFVPENKQIPNRRDHPGFVVQNVYNNVKKKLWKFTHNDFNEQQKLEIDLLVSKTVSLVGDLPDIEKEQKTLNSELRSDVVKASNYKSILEKFDMLTGDSDRDKRLKELLKAVKHKCRLTKKKKASDYESLWPNDAVPVVRALEKALYYSLEKDKPKYNHKLEVIVDQLKKSRMLAERLLGGELKPEQVITMKRYELRNGRTFDEMVAVIEEPILKID